MQWFIENRYVENIRIKSVKNVSRDLYMHIKIITSDNMDLEVESRGQFISC